MIAKTPGACVVQPRRRRTTSAAPSSSPATHGLRCRVRGGGHNIAGTALADGGVTIDMSRLRAVDVDPVARTATVEPGAGSATSTARPSATASRRRSASSPTSASRA